MTNFCSVKNGTFATLQMLLTQEVDVIFGPVCSAGTAVFVEITAQTSMQSCKIWKEEGHSLHCKPVPRQLVR